MTQKGKKRKLSEPEKEVYRERIEDYKEFRRLKAGYYQAILTGLFIILFSYTIEHLIPLIFNNIFQINSDLIVVFYSIIFLAIVTITASIGYIKFSHQTLKSVLLTENSVGTLEEIDVVEGGDGQKWVVAKTSGTIINEHPNTNKKLDDAGIKQE